MDLFRFLSLLCEKTLLECLAVACCSWTKLSPQLAWSHACKSLLAAGELLTLLKDVRATFSKGCRMNDVWRIHAYAQQQTHGDLGACMASMAVRINDMCVLHPATACIVAVVQNVCNCCLTWNASNTVMLSLYCSHSHGKISAQQLRCMMISWTKPNEGSKLLGLMMTASVPKTACDNCSTRASSSYQSLREASPIS